MNACINKHAHSQQKPKTIVETLCTFGAYCYFAPTKFPTTAPSLHRLSTCVAIARPIRGRRGRGLFKHTVNDLMLDLRTGLLCWTFLQLLTLLKSRLLQ